MFDFFKKSATWAIAIITLIFTFLPESLFGELKLLSNASSEANIILNRILVFAITLIFSMVVYAIYLCIRKRINIEGNNYSIEVMYEDIFNMTTYKKIIPFDECFTTVVGDSPSKIKPDSVCGQYLIKHPIDDINKLINKASLKPTQNKSRYQNKVRYDSGKLVPNGDFLLLAFAKLDKEGLGELSRDEFLDCLTTLWKEIDKYYGQKSVCMPVLGSGITHGEISLLSQQELLEIIILSYKLSTRKIKSPYKLCIVCKKRDDFSLNKIGEYR